MGLLMAAPAAPALAAGSPNGTAATPGDCAPYYASKATDGSWVCLPVPVVGMRAYSADVCLDAGYGGRFFTAWTCIAPDALGPGDWVAKKANDVALSNGKVGCAARGMGVTDAGDSAYVMCAGSVTAAVRDLDSAKKLDRLGDSLDVIASNTQAGSGSATADSENSTQTVALLWVILSVGVLVAVVLVFLIGVHVTGRILS